jgi:hypothetical protein
MSRRDRERARGIGKIITTMQSLVGLAPCPIRHTLPCPGADLRSRPPSVATLSRTGKRLFIGSMGRFLLKDCSCVVRAFVQSIDRPHRCAHVHSTSPVTTPPFTHCDSSGHPAAQSSRKSPVPSAIHPGPSRPVSLQSAPHTSSLRIRTGNR